MAGAAFLALCVAPTAVAADHSATLSAATPKFEWEGAPQTTRGTPLYLEQRQEIPCKTPGIRPCEDVLINLLEPGKLSIKVDGGSGDPPEGDVDLILYKSDASGAQGDKIAEGVAKGPDSVTVAKAAAGYYLAHVDYYHAFNTGYAGIATLVPSAPAVTAPVAPVVTPATQPAEAPAKAPAKKSTSKRKACQKKAKKIKNKRKRSAALKRCKKIKG